MARLLGIASLFRISIVLHGAVPRFSSVAAAGGLRRNGCVGPRVRGYPGVLPLPPSSMTTGRGVAAAFVAPSRSANEWRISHRHVVPRGRDPGSSGACDGHIANSLGKVRCGRTLRSPDLSTRCGSGRRGDGRPTTTTTRPMARRGQGGTGSSEERGEGGATMSAGDLLRVALSVLAAFLLAAQTHTLAAPPLAASAATALTSPDPTTGLIPGDDGFGAAAAAASSLARSGALGDSSAESQFNAAPYSNIQRGSVRYWDAQYSGDASLIRKTNERLLDHAVGTISNMYYDNSGGSNFNQEDLFENWKILRTLAKDERGDWRVVRYRNGNGWAIETHKDGGTVLRMPGSGGGDGRTVPEPPPRDAFSSRLNSVEGLRWLVSTLNDPYSKYLTREELRAEFEARDHDGFLGLGAMVEVPRASGGGGTWSLSKLCEQDVGFSSANVECLPRQLQTRQRLEDSMLSVGGRGAVPGRRNAAGGVGSTKIGFPESDVLSLTRVANLPVVTAVSPNSPAERSGIVVGDRIVAVGSDRFLDRTRTEVARVLKSRYAAENYAGFPGITVAKPIVSSPTSMEDDGNADSLWNDDPPKRIVGYRPSRARIATASIERFQPYSPPLDLQAMSMTSPSGPKFSGPFDGIGDAVSWGSSQPISGGNSVCHYQLLTPSDSIFKNVASSIAPTSQRSPPVGYIRLTRFSKSSTDGFMDAVKALDRLGAESYIIDVRNNYGGVVQEAMLTASTLLRDPHEVLCYTLNSRGGFTPHDVEEYIVDARFPGYLLSSEARTVTIDQVKRENPDIFKDGWSPPSSYASLREQSAKRGIRSSFAAKPLSPLLAGDGAEGVSSASKALHQQKKLVILINEGTASSAEVFASSLRDNGRAVALVGAKTYGKGLIQHTFPMPDGGGLRLTVAEYLTPALKHVTNVGSARYDRFGNLVGGGIKPDIHCDTKGIPSNAGADLCVGLALDAIQDSEASEQFSLVGNDDRANIRNN